MRGTSILPIALTVGFLALCTGGAQALMIQGSPNAPACGNNFSNCVDWCKSSHAGDDRCLNACLKDYQACRGTLGLTTAPGGITVHQVRPGLSVRPPSLQPGLLAPHPGPRPAGKPSLAVPVRKLQ